MKPPANWRTAEDEQPIKPLLGRKPGRPRSSLVEEAKRQQRALRRQWVARGLALVTEEFRIGNIAPVEVRPEPPSWDDDAVASVRALQAAVQARQRAWLLAQRRLRPIDQDDWTA